MSAREINGADSTLMTPKERILTALRGEKPDVLPAAPCYLSLYLAEAARAHYIEQYRRRMKGRLHYQVDHAEDTRFRARALYESYKVFQSPPDWIEVGLGASRDWAERTDIILRDDILCYQDRETGDCVPMDSIPLPKGDVPLKEMMAVASDSGNQLPRFSSRENIEEQLPTLTEEEWLASGRFDLPHQVAADYGDRYFISTILDTPYSDMFDILGFLGLMKAQNNHLALFHCLLQRRLAQAESFVEAWSATGIHGVFVEEVFTGSDAISPRNYEQFVFAYNKPFFQHMRGLGLLPIHYVCGDAIPRLEQIMEYDISAVAVEESKKKFRLEIEDVVTRVAGRVAVFGNIDSIRFGIQSTPEEMTAEVKRQVAIGARAHGFIVGTGSPFPLETNPRMIDMLVAAAHSLPAQA